MKIITEEMRFRKRLCEFALKYGGGGHPYASGMPLKEDIKDRIIDEIFGVTNEN